MNAYWKKLATKIDALNRRERIMVLAALLVVVGWLLNSLLLEPTSSRLRMVTTTIADNSAQVKDLQQKIDDITGVGKADPDAAKKARLKELQAKLHDAETTMERLQAKLVSPDKMPQLLESILYKNSQLKLVALKTLPVSGLLGNIQNGGIGHENTPVVSEVDALSLFRHGAEITTEGGYLDILAYIEALTKLPLRLLWGEAVLTANESGTSQLTFTVYTLSLDKTWLSI